MNPVQDTPQKLPSVSLIGVGLSTNSDNSGANKSSTFAEDLRQQISEAVASTRSRQLKANQPPTESQHQMQPLPNEVEAAQSTLVADATLPLLTETQADLNTDTIAADGSLLPPPDQSLPWINSPPLMEYSEVLVHSSWLSLQNQETAIPQQPLPNAVVKPPIGTTDGSNRSAYVNSLLASLLGNGTDNQQATSLVGEYTREDKLLMPAQSTFSVDSLQSLDGLLMPTKSLISDQQLLANVAALASETSVSSQGATIYNADQRLQQAAEARLAHLQGLQNNNASVEITTARSSGTMLPSLDASFGQAGWAERIGRQILLQSAQGSSSAQIQLDPPELGSLMIKLQLVDQTATVNFVSPHAMVRDALEQQTQRLQEMFREQGMSLTDVSVSDQSANSRQDSERQSAERDDTSSLSLANSEEPENMVAVRQSSSLVDYYA